MSFNNNIPHIAIFDSGLGGISIYNGIKKRFPDAQLSYCSDNAAFPYGTKTEAELIKRVSQVLTALNQQQKPDLLVIACNTASTVALPKIRSLINEPVVGVVPAIKPAAGIAKTPFVGLLATPATIHRAYTDELINQFGSAFDWIKVGSSELVCLAEKKMLGAIINLDDIRQTTVPFQQYSSEQLDTIVLGCTHFPLIKEELAQSLPLIKNWIDSTDAIVERVGFWLHELGFYLSSENPNPKNTLLLTKELYSDKELSLLKKIHHFQYHAFLAIH